MNDKINNMFYNIEGLSTFINKRVDSLIYKNKINIKSRWNMIKQLKKNGYNIKYYYLILKFFIGIPCINLFISTVFKSGWANSLEDLGILILSIILSLTSVFFMTYFLQKDIEKYIEEKLLKDMKLNKEDVMELGLYLTERDREILIAQINKNYQVSLRDVKNLLNEKERFYEIEKKEMLKLNKEKELDELTKSVNLIK